MDRHDPDKPAHDEPAEQTVPLRKAPHAPPPGSLRSVRIRRRSPSALRAAMAAAAAEAAPARPPAPPALDPERGTPGPERAEGASDAISARSSGIGEALDDPMDAPVRPRAEPPEDAAAAPGPRAGESAERRRPEDIVAYWSRLRGPRRFPCHSDLDGTRIGADWPNSILMRCRAGRRVPEAERVFPGAAAAAPGLSGLRDDTRVTFSPMMLQWLIGLAAEVVRAGRPMADDETFPSLHKTVRYHAVALPLSEDQSTVDHVLCHVTLEL